MLGVMGLLTGLLMPQSLADVESRNGMAGGAPVRDGASREGARQEGPEADRHGVKQQRADIAAADTASADGMTDGTTVLRVTGQIANGRVALSREALEALPRVELVTSTVVTDGAHTFSGYLMRDLLEHLGATGEQITAIALNDYVVDIPVTDFQRFDVILADRMDGERLRRDGKGPLWIVYPRDDHEVLQDIRYDYRWVWQLYRLEVL